MHKQHTPFENIVGKEEIAHNKQFLPFPQLFLLNQKIVSPFDNIFDVISLFAAELEKRKIGISGKRIKQTSDVLAREGLQHLRMHYDMNFMDQNIP